MKFTRKGYGQLRRIYVSAMRCDGDAPLIRVFEV